MSYRQALQFRVRGNVQFGELVVCYGEVLQLCQSAHIDCRNHVFAHVQRFQRWVFLCRKAYVHQRIAMQVYACQLRKQVCIVEMDYVAVVHGNHFHIRIDVGKSHSGELRVLVDVEKLQL